MAAVRRAGGRFLAREVVKPGGDHDGFFAGGGSAVSRALLAAPAPEMDAPETAGREPPPPAGVTSAMAARMTPAVLFVTVVLAVVLLVSGLLHVLRRLFLKSHNGAAGGAERQLQQLFFPPQEDGGGSGLSQDAIDALPEFAYGELSAYAGRSAAKGKAPKEDRPFDCAVCLCEFADDDRLRLLPHCGHAFHVACIDVWLRSSATCPLCRATLRRAAAAVAVGSDTSSVEAPDVEEQKQQEDAPSETTGPSSVVLPVRLGRFKNVVGEASSSASPRLDGRRCFSMGSHQYVLADDHLVVSVHLRHSNAGGIVRTSAVSVNSGRSNDDQQGKKVFARGDSFSVSKIWQWRGGDRRLPSGLRATAADDGLPPWAPPSPPTSGSTRQQRDTT